MRIADRNCVALTNSYRISVATVFGILDSSLWYQCSCTSKYLFAALRHSISFVYDDHKTHWVNSWPHFRVLGRREWMIGKQLFIIRKYYMFFVRQNILFVSNLSNEQIFYFGKNKTFVSVLHTEYFFETCHTVHLLFAFKLNQRSCRYTFKLQN